MNNQQFRRLLIDTPKAQDGGAPQLPPSRTPGAVLGARRNASIPMTPRQVGRSAIQADFARQLAERNAKANPKKKFRSAAPKGSKLAAGYTDRTKEREDDEADEVANRIKNLEDAMKLGQIDRDMFEKLVQEITGGDITATHLVKGLDRKLLERVRKGEDVYGAKTQEDEVEEPGVEDEFDELAEQEVGTIVRAKAEKKGEMAPPPPPPVAGLKRNRNALLAELKRQREEAAAAAAAEHANKYPSLGAGFRKLNQSRIEVDKQGREVLIVTDAEGKEKRKVRKQKTEDAPQEVRHDLDSEKNPVNIPDAPPPAKDEEDSEDEDIFEGVGSSYNPLADLKSDGEDDSSEDEGEDNALEAYAGETVAAEDGVSSTKENAASESGEESAREEEPDHASTKPLIPAPQPPTKRNYFAASYRFTSRDTTTPSESAAADATVRAALQKVRTLDPNSSLLNDPTSEESRLKKRAAELAARDRDMEDIDMGFGESRFDDAEEMEREGEKVKFSEWKGIGAEDGGDDEVCGQSGKKRKRGTKKKKGDKNSVGDVMKVMERQKEKTLG